MLLFHAQEPQTNPRSQSFNPSVLSLTAAGSGDSGKPESDHFGTSTRHLQASGQDNFCNFRGDFKAGTVSVITDA